MLPAPLGVVIYAWFSISLKLNTNMNGIITLKDMNGETHCFESYDLYQQLNPQLTKLVGMTLSDIVEIRKYYRIQGGDWPVTADKMKALFENK